MTAARASGSPKGHDPAPRLGVLSADRGGEARASLSPDRSRERVYVPDCQCMMHDARCASGLELRVRTGHLEGPLGGEMDLRYLAGPLKKGEKRRGEGGERGLRMKRNWKKRREEKGGRVLSASLQRESSPLILSSSSCAEFIVVPRVRYDSRPTDGT